MLLLTSSTDCSVNVIECFLAPGSVTECDQNIDQMVAKPIFFLVEKFPVVCLRVLKIEVHYCLLVIQVVWTY